MNNVPPPPPKADWRIVAAILGYGSVFMWLLKHGYHPFEAVFWLLAGTALVLLIIRSWRRAGRLL